MTEPGELSAERVAELERQLGDAMAQVAKVQAELDRAKAGDANGVPYGGQSGHGEPAMPTSVERLVEPPRQVPLSFRLSSLFALSFWELFTIMMVLVTPLAVWIFLPWLLPVVFALVVLVGGALRVRRYVRRVGVLGWGKVATVTNADEISRGSYFSGTTYQNVRLRQATGWVTTTRWYSGPGTKSTINYRIDDTDGTVTLRGLPYAGGVILADPRKPNRAFCVSSFPFSVQPDANGEYVDHGLSPWAWLGIAVMVSVYVALVAATWYAVDGLWFDLPG